MNTEHIILYFDGNEQRVMTITDDMLRSMRSCADPEVVECADNMEDLMRIADSHQLALRVYLNTNGGGYAATDFSFQSADGAARELGVDESVVLCIECAAALQEFGRQKRLGHEAAINDITAQLPSLRSTGIRCYSYHDVSEDLTSERRRTVAVFL